MPDKEKLTQSEVNHLVFIYNRMRVVYKQDENIDYMLKFKEILLKLDKIAKEVN